MYNLIALENFFCVAVWRTRNRRALRKKMACVVFRPSAAPWYHVLGIDIILQCNFFSGMPGT